MPARFTNLRPAEAKPVDRLRELHTPLYPGNETSAFCDGIIHAGLPAGITLAAARIADPDFAARAEYAVRGDPGSKSWLGASSFVALARLLARIKSETLADEVRRGELSPDLAAHIAATVGKAPPILADDPASTASAERALATATLASDDLLSLYLVPGAFADYRRLLGWLLKLKRLAARGNQHLAQLLPGPKVVDGRRKKPWPNNEPPIEWNMLQLGRILLPAEIAYRPGAIAPGAGARHAGATGALAKSGLSPADLRRIESIALSDAGTPAGSTTSNATAPDQAIAGKAVGRDQKNSN